MAKKLVESKFLERAQTDITQFGFFACEEVKNQISQMASESEGVLTDEQAAILVSAHTESIVKLHGLCNFIKLLESKIDICKQRKKEINEMQKRAEEIVDRISNRLAVWVDEKGKNYHCQEYELSTRQSKGVILVDDFDDPFYCKVEMIKKVTPDKKAIKDALESGEKISGASLEERINLSIK